MQDRVVLCSCFYGLSRFGIWAFGRCPRKDGENYQIAVPEKTSEKEDIFVLGNTKLSVIYQDDIVLRQKQ